jgi:hypothetical protein
VVDIIRGVVDSADRGADVVDIIRGVVDSADHGADVVDIIRGVVDSADRGNGMVHSAHGVDTADAVVMAVIKDRRRRSDRSDRLDTWDSRDHVKHPLHSADTLSGNQHSADHGAKVTNVPREPATGDPRNHAQLSRQPMKANDKWLFYIDSQFDILTPFSLQR